MAEGPAVATWQWDLASDLVAVTGALEDLFGARPGRCLSMEGYQAKVHPDDQEALRRDVDDLVRTGHVQSTHRVVRSDGQVRWVCLAGRLVRDDQGRPLTAAGALVDTTDAREAGRMTTILEAASDAVGTVDEEGSLRYLNPAGRRLLGLGEDEDVTGYRVSDFYADWAADLIAEEGGPTARRDGVWRGESALVLPGGTEIPVSQVLVAHDSSEGGTLFSTIVRDVSIDYEREARLRHLTEHDPLTGLRNRAALTDHLHVVVAASRRGSTGALIYLDVDQFKVVNDTMGHGAGDRLLVLVAEQLQAAIRDEDVLARLGGDEFGVLLRDVDAERATAVAEQLRGAVGELRFNGGPHTFAISASVGLALIDGKLHDSEVLAGADLACFSAKSRGRNRVVLYRPGDAEEMALTSDARWTSRLKDALEQGRMRLLYQPVVDLADGQIRRYEVLSRMVDDDGRLILPGRFIPAAERFGLVGDLDRWVVRHSVEAIRRCARDGGRLPLSINLSGCNFEDETILEQLRKEVARADLRAGDLAFEITETAAVRNLPRARRFIQDLHELGCRFSLDDFGSGFSSFAYLRHLPVDSVKIDGSFVRDLVTDPTNQALVRSMAEVARATGKVTIAECVEDEPVLDLVRGLGIDWAQGWHLGMPAAAPARLDLVELEQPDLR